MSKTEAAERIMEIAEEIRELLQEAMDLVREEGSDIARERARSYWYPHILVALGGDHGYMGGSMCSMEDTARELEGAYDEADEEEVDEDDDWICEGKPDADP
jgi:hypothetical protein